MNRTTVKSTAHLVASLALFVTTHVWGVDSYWTGSGADNRFDNQDNWSNGVPDGWFAVDPSQQSFSKYLMGLGTSIKNLSGVVYFNNGEEEFSVSADEGGGFSVSGNMYIGESGKTGDVCFNSGTYSVNDLSMSPANNSGKSTLTVDGAALNVRYWMYTSSDNAASESTIDLKSGSITTGAETSGNGNFYLCRANGSKGTVTQSGGTFLVQPRSDVYYGNPYGMVLGVGERSTATYTKTGGSLKVNGALRIGLGSSSNAAFVQKGGAEGNTTVTEANLDVGVASGATGLLAVSNGTITCKKSLNVAVSGGTGKFVLAGGTVNVANCSYWAADTGSKSDVEISGGTLNFNGANDNYGALRILNGSNSTLTMDINGGTVNLNGDMQLGAGSSGNAEINISNGGVLCCGPSGERWFKIGYGIGSESTVNLQTGGLLDIWYMDHPSTGLSTLKFDGGTLRAKQGTDNLINDANDASFDVIIGDKGGVIDTQGFGVTIKKKMSGTGTITKRGAGALTLTGSYAGGIKVENGAGSVTTPGNQQLSAGQNVFLVSKVSAEMTCEQAGNLAADRPIWFESNGQIELKDCTLDFSTQEEQLLFAATSITVDGAPVASNADIASYVHVLNATEAHKVIFKDNGVYAVADLIENKWIGGESGEWSNPDNWSGGVPTETSHVVFDKDVVVKRSDQSVKKCWVKLTLENNARVEFWNDNDDNYPTYEIAAGCLEGTGTLVLTHCGMNAATSDVTIPATISVVFKNNTGAIDGSVDCWLNNFGATHIVTINGDVTVEDYLVTRGGVIFNGGVTITNGARIYIDEGSATFNGNLTIDGSGILDKKAGTTVAKGDNAQLTLTGTGTPSINADLAQQFGLDTSVNEWIGGAAGSWSLACNWSRGIPTDKQTVRFDSDAAVTLDGSKTVSNIVNNAYVQFRTTNTGVHPTLYIREVNGTGTNALWHAGFIANGLPGTIAAEATVEILNCGNSDSWLEGDYEASPLKIYGNICGNGYLICRDYVYFYGDTSGHTANVLMEQAGQKHFCSTTSGFPSSARLEIQGTATVDCMDGVTFGALNIAEWNVYRGFDVPEGFEGTIKVGANNKDATIGNTMSFFEILNAGGWNTGCAAATLEKIGSGTLRCGIQNACKIQVTEGTVEFTAATMEADITVAAGATLSGTTDQTVKSVKFEDGAYYRLTSNSLTAANIEFGKDVYLYLNEADRVKAASGTVLSGTVTGSPMATVLNEAKTGIAACNDEGWYWTASKEEPGVKLVSAEVAATAVATGAETPVSVRDADLSAWLTAKGAADKVNETNDNGVTGILAYMLGAETYVDATKPTMGAEIADGVATLTFDDSAFRGVPGLKLAYYLESCDAADFSGEVVRSEESDDPAVPLEFANAKIFNRLCADVRASE